jgi:radical SAM superfamily enzyme YgiQ (UPF0313 family)
VKLILPALLEATAPGYRPIKYALFPPLGLAGLAGYLDPDSEIELVDEHLDTLDWDDAPDLVVMTVYITSAKRAYRIADHYRARGVHVCLGGLHPSSRPDEAAAHADTVFIGPGEESWPRFLADFRHGRPAARYVSETRSLVGVPPLRRDLIDRRRYLCPNSLVVSRGCPHHCDFCYKDAFYEGGRSFYTLAVDEALAEIERLPGRHLYFLDDHLLGNRRFAEGLFAGMEGMGRVFQGASTVQAILQTDLIERAARAGMRSVFVGFETLNEESLRRHAKRQNLSRSYDDVIRRCHDTGVMVNGSFVFGLDDDGPDVFDRTVEWAISRSLETATFHIMTPYPGTALHQRLVGEGRIVSSDWNRYEHAPRRLQAAPDEPRRARVRILARLSRVLSLARHRAWSCWARHAATHGPPFRLRRRVEEARAALGSDHPRPSCRRDAARPRAHAQRIRLGAGRSGRPCHVGGLGFRRQLATNRPASPMYAGASCGSKNHLTTSR